MTPLGPASKPWLGWHLGGGGRCSLDRSSLATWLTVGALGSPHPSCPPPPRGVTPARSPLSCVCVGGVTGWLRARARARMCCVHACQCARVRERERLEQTQQGGSGRPGRALAGSPLPCHPPPLWGESGLCLGSGRKEARETAPRGEFLCAAAEGARARRVVRAFVRGLGTAGRAGSLACTRAHACTCVLRGVELGVGGGCRGRRRSSVRASGGREPVQGWNRLA